MQRRSLILGGVLLWCASVTGAAQVTTALVEQPAPKPSTVPAPIFEVDPAWPKPMQNHWILGAAAGLAVDAQDNVFVLNLADSANQRAKNGSGSNPSTTECCTSAPNVLEFDSAGNLLGGWGGPAQGYVWPSANAGLGVDPYGHVWIGGTGPADTQILKFARDGRFYAQFGTVSPGALDPEAPVARGRARTATPPTPATPASSNDVDAFGGADGFSFDSTKNEAYVADGSRNHRVAVIDMGAGVVKRYWGAYGRPPDDARVNSYVPGHAEPEFSSPVSCAKLSKDGLVYVCDSRNDRIQVFRKDGSFIAEKMIAPNTLGRGSVSDIAFSAEPTQTYLYVADGTNMKIHVLDRQSLDEITSFDAGSRRPGESFAVRSIATDSKGNIYMAASDDGTGIRKFVYRGLANTPQRR